MQEVEVKGTRSLEYGRAMLWAALGAVFIACYYQTFLWLNYKYSAAESYFSHGYLIPLISAYLIYQKRDELAQTALSGSRFGLAVILAALIIHIFGVLSYVNGKNRDTGDDLYNIMPLNAKLTLTHQLGGWNSGLELQAVKRKNAVSDVRNEIPTAGYSLAHLRSSYSWDKFRIDFGIENLFNRAYALPLGGAYMGQGRTMSMNPTDGTMAWGTAVPGMGRSLYAGVNMKF